MPSPTLDLAAPYKSVYGNLFSDGLQALEFDPLGAAIRSTTRTYRGNSSDYSKLQVFQALATLDNLERGPDSFRSCRQPVPRDLFPPQPLHACLRRLGSRTTICRNITTSRPANSKQTRGHNWELLRQRAELNGLIFEPLALASGTPSEALLWIARSDLEHAPNDATKVSF